MNNPIDIFENIYFSSRNDSVPFCGACEMNKSETVGNGAACTDMCTSMRDVDWSVYVLGVSTAFCLVFKALVSTPEDPQVI